MMNVLVTGATGFIGSNLVKELVKRGHEVTCLARKNSDLRCLEDLDIQIIYGDCTDKETLQKIPKRFSHIFHLAGLTKAGKEEDFYRTNTEGTENLLDVLSGQGHSAERFIYMSSLAAAGPSCEGTPLDENAEPKPVSWYGLSKLRGEQATLAYRDRIPVSIVRPPAVYGPRDRDFFLFFRMIKKGFYPYWGKCYYSLLYVDDLIEGLIAVACSPASAGRTYFLADGGIYSNDEIIDEIMHAMDLRAVRLRTPAALIEFVTRISERFSRGATIINSDKLREIRHHHWTCSSKQAENDLGFTPKVGLKEGIKWTADWYRIHRWL